MNLMMRMNCLIVKKNFFPEVKMRVIKNQAQKKIRFLWDQRRWRKR